MTRDAVEANVVAAGLVDHSFTKELVGGPGDTMNIPYISNPTANTKTANTNINLEVISPTSAEASQSFTVATHQHVAFALENITKVQSQTNLADKYTGKAGYALAAAADTNLHLLPQNFSGSYGVLGVEPTYDNWLRGSQALDDALAPTTDRFIIVRPATKYALLKLDEFKSSLYNGDNAGKAVRENFIGRAFGADVYVSTLVRAPAAGQAENWFCHPLGVYLCEQETKTSPPTLSIDRDAMIVLATKIYGYAEALQPPVTAGGGAATDVFNVLINGVS